VAFGKVLGVAVICIVLTRGFVAQGFLVAGDSMTPALQPGDVLLVNKAALGTRLPWIDFTIPGYASPRRGDILVFRAYEGSRAQRVAKRLVGMPNDTVMMKQGILYVNGDPLDEPYATRGELGQEASARMLWQLPYLREDVDPSTYFPTMENWGPLVVPPDQYFVLGDNRSHSIDSRLLGFVPRVRIIGRVDWVYFSLDPDCCRGMALLRAVRWGRIGRPSVAP
jgi:signal peptidase I